jgi:predicted dinucleotide-binding enzyme
VPDTPKIIDAIATHKYFSIDGLFPVCSNPKGSKARAGTVAEAAATGDVIVLPATRNAIQAAISRQGRGGCTNPLKPNFTGLALGYMASGAEQVAEWTKGAKVFKAFNQTGFNNMADPAFDGERPSSLSAATKTRTNQPC